MKINYLDYKDNSAKKLSHTKLSFHFPVKWQEKLIFQYWIKTLIFLNHFPMDGNHKPTTKYAF